MSSGEPRKVMKTFYIDHETEKKLVRLSVKYDVPQASLVRNALKQYLDKIEKAGGLTV